MPCTRCVRRNGHPSCRDRDRRALPLCLDTAEALRSDEHQLRASAAHRRAATDIENRPAAPVLRARSRTMPSRVNINGVITPPEEAKISVLDHGLLFGDSVYETLRTYGGKPFLFSRHFARLEHSAEAIHLKLPWSNSKTREEVQRTLMSGECRVRVIFTRGVGELEADIETCTAPTALIIVVPLVLPPERIYEQGVDVVISSVRRGRLADIKSGNLI